MKKEKEIYRGAMQHEEENKYISCSLKYEEKYIKERNPKLDLGFNF